MNRSEKQVFKTVIRFEKKKKVSQIRKLKNLPRVIIRQININVLRNEFELPT